MKKTIKLLTVLYTTAIFLSIVCVAAYAVNTDTKYLRGDANGDGIVSISDITAIQKHLADLEPLSGADLQAAEVDGNVLDITDATEIQRFLAEFENSYHIGDWVNVESTQSTIYWIKPGDNELPFIPN